MPTQSYPSTLGFLSQDLFRPRYEDIPRIEHVEYTYLRARELCRHYALTMDDVLYYSPKFWHLNKDGMAVVDPIAQALISIQTNLVAGTIATYAVKRPDLRPLFEKIVRFDVATSFMLNEIGHGNDASNLETTATLRSDGGFTLQSPTPDSYKFMPPSMPVAGIPRVAVVFARLMVDGEDRGVRPFIVSLGDGKKMCTGVTSYLIPPVACGRMMDHAITSFHGVSLPPNAMLGDLAKPDNFREAFLKAIGRIGAGTLALSLWVIPFLKSATFIVGKYSMRRTVQLGLGGDRAPIISFRTQHMPVLHALAQISVLEAFADWATTQFTNTQLDPRSRYGIAVIVKAVFVNHGQDTLAGLIERSGAQGVFLHNQMTVFEALTRITTIAEGDIQVLSIRLATELLIGRYKLPSSTKPLCLLAQHEAGIIAELEQTQNTDANFHRGEEYNARILRHCRSMVVAIGLRMAYEAAAEAGVDPDLLALYEAGAMRSDSSWYVENLGLKRATQLEMERKALDEVFPKLDKLLDQLDIEPYCSAPMLSQSRWEALIKENPIYRGNGQWDALADDTCKKAEKLARL
ncbi:hypothetical protein BGW36DRAFT_42969 [Talaromyces proteolyticus]|uniref:Acyl-CoA oxidase n=1 Tax=Talaromyces proteolyticus TaxID=1131652 RepID=A0AAD4PWP4_9EURO|nr:uncharacterized protein BGW36DRAFT_42969 [Talaromyces proteolyticus]KAH8692187.1 hypothetical protein BGW36DRAFT_42969 [Talaromyces proteolyticus]